MKIVVKELQREKQAEIEVPLETNVAELKYLVLLNLGIPVDQQQIIFAGNSLSDDSKKLTDYDVREGSALFVLLKKAEANVLRDATYRYLRQFYNESDSNKIVHHFMVRFNQQMAAMSLDDLERMATMFLEDEQRLAEEAQKSSEQNPSEGKQKLSKGKQKCTKKKASKGESVPSEK